VAGRSARMKPMDITSTQAIMTPIVIRSNRPI
jgi:hypothetical protein